MLFSIILATLNRSVEIEMCLQSLENQIEKDFEIIIVDQSNDDKTRNVAEKYENLIIKYYNVTFKGLSKARNYGIKHATGSYLCLIDDDAIYSENYLLEAKKAIHKHGEIVVSGKILNIEDRTTPFVKYDSKMNDKPLTVKGIVNFCPSAALVIPTSAVSKIGDFNERLGVGNCFAAGEETDYLLRIFDSGYKIYFCEKMIAYHPIKPVVSLEPVYKHYMGKGALFKIDFCSRKRHRLCGLALRNTIGMLLKAYILDRKNKTLYIARKNGFIEGFNGFGEGDK